MTIQELLVIAGRPCSALVPGNKCTVQSEACDHRELRQSDREPGGDHTTTEYFIFPP